MTTTSAVPNVGTNPLKGLLAYGQSPWMDYIRRDLLTSGGLKKMIDQDGLRGMTSNPTIFEKAIVGSNVLLGYPGGARREISSAPSGVYEKIAIRDVQDATDIFKPVYSETKRRDGYVSLEVSPLLANDTKATIDEARRLWKTVNRENLMVKVPATPAGIPAIRQLLEDGININITLLFAQSAYEQVAEAFLSALEARVKKGQDVSHIASVASFFVSRIDTLIDNQIEAKLKTETDAKKRAVDVDRRQSGDCQRQAHLQKVSGAIRRSAVEGSRGQRRANTTIALGQHQHQESQVSRCSLRGRTDRSRHR